MSTHNPVPTAKARGRGSRTWIPAILSVGISAALVIWILSTLGDPAALLDSFGSASVPLLLAIVPVSLASHAVRATRWRRFLGTRDHAGASFASLMLGYSLNVVVPRGGEVARVVAMNRASRIAVPRLAATVLAERILDVIALVALIGVSFLIDGDRIEATMPELARVAPGALAGASIGVAFVVAVAVAGGQVARILETVFGRIHAGLGRRVGALAREAVEGFAILRRPVDASIALVETLAIWGLYLLTFVLGLAAFSLLETTGLEGATVVFAVTSASVLIPSQGAIGVFHKFGETALTELYGVLPETALACVTALHAILFLFVGGVLGAAVFGTRWLLARGQAVPRGDAS